MRKSIYKCSSCGREFKKDEFKLTNEEDKCVVHSKKLESLTDSVLEEFWKEIEKEFTVTNEIDNEELSQEMDELYGTSSFLEYTIDKYIFKDLIFPKPIVDLHFTEVESNKNIYFINCYFTKEINFRAVFKAKRVFFINCKFFDDLNLNNIQIQSSVEFYESYFFLKLNLENTRFENFVSFENNWFNCFNFKNTVFENKVIFRKSIFNNDTNFEYVTFKDVSIFKNSIFKKKINLIDTIFEKNPSFLGISSSEDSLQKINVENRETARIIKDSFEQQNNIIEANKFYQLEMRKMEDELYEDIKEFKNIFQYLVFMVHRFSSNHSQNALLSLFWIILFTLFFSFYTSIDIVNTRITDISFFETYKYVILHERFVDISKLILCLSVSIITIIILWITSFKIKIVPKWILFMFILMVIYGFYSFLTGDWRLLLFSTNVNPFSIITQDGKLGFAELIYRISIAYLIYQLIISIRQNTRRK